MATKKKEGMLGKAVRGLNKKNINTGATPIRARPKPAPASKPVVNKNKRGITPTTSAAKARAQKEAIQKRIDTRVQASRAK